MKKILKRLIAAPFVLIAAIFVLFEEWLWDDLQLAAAAIGRLPVFRQVEAFITGLPPYAALAMFAAPSLLLVPVKLIALYFITHGQPALGLATVIGAKVAGTALIARIYALTHPNLMRILWFARLNERFMAFKTRIHEAIRSTVVYKTAQRLRLRMRATAAEYFSKRHSLWRSRWGAALKLSRRWRQSR
ncbi:MAG: hypothetical protein J2P21_22185 [Chloracidobacterium sp.]|nr:hypothetical protein [Chloracidobacterium sp.]